VTILAVVDAGPLYAAADADDQDHLASRRSLSRADLSRGASASRAATARAARLAPMSCVDSGSWGEPAAAIGHSARTPASTLRRVPSMRGILDVAVCTSRKLARGCTPWSPLRRPVRRARSQVRRSQRTRR
jgi:hypothetical protein